MAKVDTGAGAAKPTACDPNRLAQFCLRKTARSGRGKATRRGSTLVEFAFVVPLAFLTVFVAVEFGRLLMVLYGLEETARLACRTAVSRTATRKEVVDQIDGRMRLFGISDYAITLIPDPPDRAPQWEPVSVEITVEYGRASWLPTPRFLDGITLTGTCTLSQESDESST